MIPIEEIKRRIELKRQLVYLVQQEESRAYPRPGKAVTV